MQELDILKKLLADFREQKTAIEKEIAPKEAKLSGLREAEAILVERIARCNDGCVQESLVPDESSERETNRDFMKRAIIEAGHSLSTREIFRAGQKGGHPFMNINSVGSCLRKYKGRDFEKVAGGKWKVTDHSST